MGPVQVVIVGFEEPNFTGEVLAEFTRLREAGIVRLVDLLVVHRTEDGTLITVEPPEEQTPGFGVLAAAILSESDEKASEIVIGEGDVETVSTWSLDDVVPEGATAAVALIEHVWAQPLKAAIERAGGTPLEETWLAPRELEALELLMTAPSSGRRD